MYLYLMYLMRVHLVILPMTNFFQINTSDQNRVLLRNLNLRSAGQYRCVVSAEAPLFNTVSRSNRMEIVGEEEFRIS